MRAYGVDGALKKQRQVMDMDKRHENRIYDFECSALVGRKVKRQNVNYL